MRVRHRAGLVQRSVRRSRDRSAQLRHVRDAMRRRRDVRLGSVQLPRGNRDVRRWMRRDVGRPEQLRRNRHAVPQRRSVRVRSVRLQAGSHARKRRVHRSAIEPDELRHRGDGVCGRTGVRERRVPGRECVHGWRNACLRWRLCEHQHEQPPLRRLREHMRSEHRVRERQLPGLPRDDLFDMSL
jgi:hypothetical protein